MKTTKILIGLALTAGIVLSSCQNHQTKAKLVTGEDSASYALGIFVGAQYAQDMKNIPFDISNDALFKGFVKGFIGDTANYQINHQELSSFLDAFFMKKNQEMIEKRGNENIAILRDNKAKEGVQVTSSGLQYRILEEGKGKIPVQGDVVRVHYVGKLADGTEFDSSVKRGAPAEFNVGGVIPGFSEALLMMPVGSVWEIVIPSELGYGNNPAGNIPPNSVLFFNIQLLDILPKAK